MPNLKISELTLGDPALFDDEIPVNRAGANFKVTAQTIANLNPQAIPWDATAQSNIVAAVGSQTLFLNIPTDGMYEILVSTTGFGFSGDGNLTEEVTYTTAYGDIVTQLVTTLAYANGGGDTGAIYFLPLKGGTNFVMTLTFDAPGITYHAAIGLKRVEDLIPPA